MWSVYCHQKKNFGLNGQVNGQETYVADHNNKHERNLQLKQWYRGLFAWAGSLFLESLEIPANASKSLFLPASPACSFLLRLSVWTCVTSANKFHHVMDIRI